MSQYSNLRSSSRLLGTRGQRPCRRCARDKHDERAPLHLSPSLERQGNAIRPGLCRVWDYRAGSPLSARGPMLSSGSNSTPPVRLVGTAKAPQVGDGIAAARRTVSRCHFQPSYLHSFRRFCSAAVRSVCGQTSTRALICPQVEIPGIKPVSRSHCSTGSRRQCCHRSRST